MIRRRDRLRRCKVIVLNREQHELGAAGSVALAEEGNAGNEVQAGSGFGEVVVRRTGTLSRRVHSLRLLPFRARPVTSPRQAVAPSVGYMNLWEERIARNEALFREVNERVAEVQGSLGDGGTPEFVCECADDTCTERIAVPMGMYERVRNDSHLFLVRPGHQLPEVERVVETDERFLVVCKDSPTAQKIAEQTDPRS